MNKRMLFDKRNTIKEIRKEMLRRKNEKPRTGLLREWNVYSPGFFTLLDSWKE